MRHLRTLMLLGLALMLAQSARAIHISWGVEGGMDFNKVSLSKQDFNPSRRTGWFVGPKAKLKLRVAGLCFDGAFLYNQKGLAMSDGEGNEYTKALPYFVAPINMRYGFNLGRLAHVYVATGPQWNWFIGQDTDIPGYEGTGTFDRSSFSWNAGAGVELFRHLQVGLTYNVGITSAGRVHDDSGKGIEADLNNNSIQLRVAFYFK